MPKQPKDLEHQIHDKQDQAQTPADSSPVPALLGSLIRYQNRFLFYYIYERQCTLLLKHVHNHSQILARYIINFSSDL